MGMLPLGWCRTGERVKVVDVTGGRGVKMRLEAIGIVPGAGLEVIKGPPGPVLVKVNGGTRVMLGRGEAMKVLVEPVRE